MGGTSHAVVARRTGPARKELARGDGARRRGDPQGPGRTNGIPDDAEGRAAEVPVQVSEEEWTRLALWWLGAAGPLAEAGGDPDRGAPSAPVVWELRPGELLFGCERAGGGPPERSSGQGGGPLAVRLDETMRSGASWRGRAAHQAALATVAAEPGRRVLVELLAAGSTSLEGGRQDRERFLRRLLDELAERRWSPFDRLVVVGLPDLADALGAQEGTIQLERVEQLEELGLLEHAGPLPTGARGRRGAGSSRGSTLLVLGGEVAAALPGELSMRLAAAVRSGRGQERSLALLLGGPWPASSWVLEVAPGGERAVVRPAELQQASREPAGPRAAALATAVVESTGPAPALLGELDPQGFAPGTDLVGADARRRAVGPGAKVAGPPAPEAAAEIEVAVLGRAEVRGVPSSFAGRPRLTELVVYLALHPDGATAASWSTALWPRRRVPCQTMSNRVSEARHLLGVATDGRPRLRRAGDIYRLAEVSTDWQRFKALSDRTTGVDSWREALSLVRGRPLQDLSSSLWTALEYMAAEMERVVSECALACGEALLDAGDFSGAEWSLQQGLRATPWDERLVRLRMLTADAAGNRAGVEAVMRHLLVVMEIDGDPRDQLHPETLALYRRLTGHELVPGR